MFPRAAYGRLSCNISSDPAAASPRTNRRAKSASILLTPGSRRGTARLRWRRDGCVLVAEKELPLFYKRCRGPRMTRQLCYPLKPDNIGDVK
jgi:hypothetical protein